MDPSLDPSSSPLPTARPISAQVETPHAIDYAVPLSPFHGPPLPEPSSRWAAVIDLVLLGVLSFVIMVVVQWGAHVAQQFGWVADLKSAVPAMTVVIGVLTTGVVLAMLAVRKHPLATIGWTWDAVGVNAAIGAAIWAAIMALSLMFIMLLYAAWPSGFEDFSQTRTRIEDVLPRISIPMILLMSLVTGIYEEVLFRGILLTRLRQLFGSTVAAVLASSLLFGSMHFYEGFAAVIIITIFGFLLAMCVVWRRSLVAAMVAHFLFNAVQLTMLSYVSETWA